MSRNSRKKIAPIVMGTIHHQVMHGALHVLELPAPFEGVSRRQCNPGVNLAFQLRHVAPRSRPCTLIPTTIRRLPMADAIDPLKDLDDPVSVSTTACLSLNRRRRTHDTEAISSPKSAFQLKWRDLRNALKCIPNLHLGALAVRRSRPSLWSPRVLEPALHHGAEDIARL